MMAVLHTSDQVLADHSHLNFLVPAGALSDDKNRWIDCIERPVWNFLKRLESKPVKSIEHVMIEGFL